MPAPSRFDGLSRLPLVSGWAGLGAASTSCGCPPCVCCMGTDPHPCACSQHGAASGATRAKTCRTQHASATQGEPRPGHPQWPGPLIPVPIPTPVLTPLCRAVLQEGTLWGVLAILSLLAGLATGALRTPHCNETLDAAPTPRDVATASPSAEDGVEMPLAWSQLHGACWDRGDTLGLGGRCHTWDAQPGHGGPKQGGGGWVLQWVSDGSPQGTVHLVVLGGQG